MSPTAPQPERRPVRWWPAIAILALMAGLLAYFWLGDATSTQNRVIPTFPILFFGVLLLFVWLVLFSRLPGQLRKRTFLSVLVLVALGFFLLEIKGVDGDLVPIVGYRWAPERSFETASGTAGVTAPGPNDYPQFYGPTRDARLPGPRLARDWEARPPRELWRREVGEGWSSFAIVGRAAMTMEQRGDDEVVVRYELETGEQIWVHSDHAPFNTTVGGRGPRATPTIADGRVYTLGATGLLTCLELDSGAVVWQRRLLEEYSTSQPDWGMPSSPLIVGDLLVVQLGLMGNAMVAHDRASGEPVWRADIEQGSYSTPVLATLAGREQIVTVNQPAVSGHDPTTGERRWKRGRYRHGQIILVGDLLLIQTEKGDVVLVEANPDEHRELARLAALDGKTWNPPALSGNLLLVRNNREAVCYELPLAG